MPEHIVRMTADTSSRAPGVENSLLPEGTGIQPGRRVDDGAAAGVGSPNLNYKTSWDSTALQKQVGAPRCDAYIEFLHCPAKMLPLSDARKSLSGNASLVLSAGPPRSPGRCQFQAALLQIWGPLKLCKAG
jgi:hypothetical protein